MSTATSEAPTAIREMKPTSTRPPKPLHDPFSRNDGIKLMKITTRGNGQDILRQCERGGTARLLMANEQEHEQLEEIETLAQMALELCWEIEKFPVSVHQTNAAIQAARLRAAILEKGIARVQ